MKRGLTPFLLTVKRGQTAFLLTAITGLMLMTNSGPTNAASDTKADGERMLTDFTGDSADFGWFVLNDNVMGGRSEGDFAIEPGKLHFSGNTNTRGGGFSSIRTQALELDLSGYAGVRLHVLGDGRRYTWRLETTALWRGRPVSYWAEFETEEGEWITVDIPFAAFVPRFRGYELPGPELDVGQITGMGLMIYDKQDGPFALQLGSVRAYVPVQPPG